MVASALSANRSISVINWIVGHAGEAFSLSELSRALDINIPSLMSVLQSLTDAGYLDRHPKRKTYEAGPALLAVSLVIGAHLGWPDILGSELKSLAASVESECFASLVVGDHIVIVADAGRPSSKAMPIKVGLRFRLMAPFGHVFTAWSSPGEIEDWIRRAEEAGHDVDRAKILAELARTRELGYSIGRATTNGSGGMSAKKTAASASAISMSSAPYEVVEPEPDHHYDIAHITAPVFNAQGKVILGLVINGFSQIEGRELLARTERLLQSARLITKHSGGQDPADLR